MTLVTLMAREMRFHWGTVMLGLVGAAIAAGVVVGGVMLLRVHDARTEHLVREKEAAYKEAEAELNENLRKDMLKLGFNLMILPEGQNLRDFYAEDFAAKDMPEAYGERLVNSGTVLVQHIFPVLQQKIFWTEAGRTVILVGTRGELARGQTVPRKPLVQPVPEGCIVLGHEVHTSLALRPGDTVTLRGRRFQVHACHPERGSKDDITVWIPLRDAQDLLGKHGRINSILALECVCAAEKQATIREEIMRILPGVQVVEMGTKILARAESRLKAAQQARAVVEQVKTERARLRAQRERMVTRVACLVLGACALCLMVLIVFRVRSRRSEIGILRALGVRSGQILALVMGPALGTAVAGGAVGAAAGVWLGRIVGVRLDAVSVDEGSGPVLLYGLGVALLLNTIAAWLPALWASRQDSAGLLRGDR